MAGVATLVATFGLTTTVRSQISDRFNALEATEVRVEEGAASPTSLIPASGPQQLEELNGVVTAGLFWRVDTRQQTTTALWDAAGRAGLQLPVIAASPTALDVLRPKILGARYDSFHEGRRERIALVGASAARELGIGRPDGQRTIFIGDIPFAVAGIIEDVDRHPEVLSAVVVPAATAAGVWTAGAIGPRSVIIETLPGAAQLVARQAAVALRPDAPNQLRTIAPPDPKSLRNEVDQDVTRLMLALAGIAIVIGGIGIANSTLLAVLERTPEIGLRRALGATRRHVAVQFLLESSALGTLGGIVGSAVGIFVIVGAALAQQWTPVIEPVVALTAPLLGTMMGLIAGTYPARRAAGVEPVEALRR